jgi:electron transfer flavoprotein beta subunit
VAFVKKIEEITEKGFRVERMMETGYDVIEIPLPCALTVVKEINEPRVPSLKGKMRAKKYEPKVITSSQLVVDPSRLGLKGSPTQVIKIFSPEIRKSGVKFEGTTEEVVEKLYKALKEDKILI